MAATSQRLALFLSLLAGASACGEATLGVDLVVVDGDNPFDDLVRVEAVVFNGSDVTERASVTVPEGAESGNLALDAVPRDGGLRILVTGYDADEIVIAAGAAAPQLPSRDGSCCVRICFCTMPLYDNGYCDCGSDSCGRCS